LEAELLGLAGDTSEPEPKPKVVAKKPVKRVAVASAFRYATSFLILLHCIY
jgi:hypothetical protein